MLDNIKLSAEFTSVYHSEDGWKAIYYVWDELEQKYILFHTSVVAWETREKAVKEAKMWATNEEILYLGDF